MSAAGTGRPNERTTLIELLLRAVTVQVLVRSTLASACRRLERWGGVRGGCCHVLKPQRHIVDNRFRHLAEVVRRPSLRIIAIVRCAQERECIDATQQQRGVLQCLFARHAGIHAEQAFILSIARAERSPANRLQQR